MKKEYFAVMVGVVVLVIIGFFVYPLNLFSAPVSAGTCEIVLENSGDDKVDIVFLTDEVSKDKIEEYSDYLINSEPFSNNKEKFNFYYAGDSDKCGFYKENILFCYSRDLIKKSAVCPNDYIFVLSLQSSRIRSSAYMNVLSINTNHPKTVLLHEFGHVFSNLADEYVPSVIPRGSDNCQNSCDDFEQENIDGCYEGCSKSTYYRSSDTSVMKSLNTKDYRTLNTLIIEENLEEYEN